MGFLTGRVWGGVAVEKPDPDRLRRNREKGRDRDRDDYHSDRNRPRDRDRDRDDHRGSSSALFAVCRDQPALNMSPSKGHKHKEHYIGRHLVGVRIGGIWNGHFPESEKYFSEAEISRKMPEIPQKERFLPNFRLRNLKIQSPKKMQFHTPSHSIPPLDSLLLYIILEISDPRLPSPQPSGP